ncbi:MAG TPA: PHP domain-containing protein [Planctomycetota bacterium]|nr:PHP domain-containing protein [Planctomycetota bacterium]
MTEDGRADLHLHTCRSDGSYEPAELVRRAAELDFTVIAVTDHDSLSAFGEASAEGKRSGVRVISGVELSTVYNNSETHIVGLFVDPANADLVELTAHAASERRRRIFRIAERLADLGVEISAEEVIDAAAGAAVGRLHVAEALVNQGAAGSVSESFYRYLGDNRPAYVRKWSPTPEECCRVIHGAGGVAVLGHPGDAVDPARVEALVRAGCRALEAYYPIYSRTLTEAYVELAEKLNVGVSGGSDCHGSRKDVTYLGTVSVPMTCVRDLERRRG